jgi:hypothetical protein
MADSAVSITAGTGTSIDTRTESTNGNHRQVVVLGDPATNAGVAPVDATAGLKVDLGTDNDVTVSNTVTVSTGLTQPTTPSDTQPISASNLPLPTGAATSAKQPALGTAGTPSSDVITVQGKSGMTAIVVDGSGITQPVNGTVTANIGTSGSLALDATLTGGTAKSVVRGGTKGTTSAADVTSTASGSNHQPLDVAIYDASGNQVTSFGGGTQYSNGSSQATPTGTVTLGYDGTNVRALKTDNAGDLSTSTTNGALETGGNLATVASAVTSSVMQDNIKQINGATPLMGNGTTGTGSLRVTVASDNTAFSVNNTPQKNASPTSTTMQNAATANGNGTNLAVDGYSTAIVSITASVAMSGGTTINFEASTDNTTFVNVQAINVGTNTIAATTTATGDWQVDVTGYSFLRARISSYSAGTITVKGWPISIAATPKVVNSNIIGTVPVSGTITANAGTNLNTSALALETGGNLASVATNTTNIPNVVGTAASAIPSKFLQIGGSDGTNARAISTTTSGLIKIDLSGTAANSTAIKVDGSAVTQPVSLTSTTITGTVAVTESGTWNVGLNSGTNTIGDVNLTAAARGGYSVSSQTSLTSTATISGSAGKFGGIMFMNLNSAPAYIQVFDTTSAVTLGTTTPTFVIPIPANATAANGVAAVHEFSVGISIANGIKVAATTTATGSTTVSTGLTGFVMYK